MGKKKEKTFNEPESTVDLKSMIHENALFFDKLVELIPARFYLPDEKDKPWYQGLSKAEKASAKKQSRENIKKARRDRLDPEKSSKTTLDLLKENLEKEKLSKESDGEEEIEVRPIMSDLDGAEERAVTYEELRQRLRRKIEELRGGRNSAGSDKGKKRNERNDKKGNVQMKRKRDSGVKEKKGATSNDRDKVKKDMEEAAKELTFSHVKLGDEEKHGKKKKRKLSKLKELENAMKLEEAKKDLEKGEVIARKQSWKSAMDRAAGIKVHDDPKLLKQSIQKEKKMHQKNVEKWNARVETKEKLKAEKQQKRSENISEKIHQKKMRRIAKREKKLLRPGFEGRKEGFINEGSS
ncbi:ribosomal RNA-processing protein 14-like [Durio zibethinus]|uniref:Ribosomal RNA-processing protein 14-like n=1 Tax=Durio zibethinus TaxID=66656 RepID=A0A6P5X167_DURZI|nr:ribosomal RNA-processing protein 14-like [Durio zibethinus]